jgi:hypothetical protein
MATPQKLLPAQLSLDVFVALKLARDHALPDLLAVGTEPRTALNQEIDYVIIEWEEGITALTFGFEQDSFGAHRPENLTDRSIRVTDRMCGHGGPPR